MLNRNRTKETKQAESLDSDRKDSTARGAALPSVLLPTARNRRTRTQNGGLVGIVLAVCFLLFYSTVMHRSFLSDVYIVDHHASLPLTTEIKPRRGPKGQAADSSYLWSSETSNKPKLYLHVGPMEMSSLQCSLASFDAQRALAADSFTYLGHAPPAEVCGVSPAKSISGPHNQINHRDYFLKSNKKLGNEFKAQLVRASQMGWNVIVVSDLLADFTSQEAQALYNQLSDNWDVIILFEYRRFYDFAPKYYYQLHQPSRNIAFTLWPRVRENDIVGQPIEPFNLDPPPTLIQWNSTTGARPSSSFDQRWFDFVRRSEEEVAVADTEKSLGGGIQDRWSMVSLIRVNMVNLESANRIKNVATADATMIRLFCDGLKLRNLCESSKSGKMGSYRVAPSFPVNYDILATSAYENRLIHTRQMSRADVVKAIQRRQEQELKLTHDTFPLSCAPRTTLKRLLDITLKMESQFYPDKKLSVTERDLLESDFENHVHNNEYCSINVREVLKDEGWQNFFRDLGS